MKSGPVLRKFVQSRCCSEVLPLCNTKPNSVQGTCTCSKNLQWRNDICYLSTNYFLKKYLKPCKLFFLINFKPWIMQQFGSLIIWTCQGLIRGLVQVPIWTTTFILRKDAKKISYPFKIISIQPSSVIYSFLYLWRSLKMKFLNLKENVRYN